MTTREIAEAAGDSPPPRQRSARTDPSMRDGDSGLGNPYENADADFSTDTEIGDSVVSGQNEEELESGPGPSPTRPHAESASDKPPFNEYDQLSAVSIKARVAEFSADELRPIAYYERTHRNRKVLMAYFNRRLNREP